MTETTGPSEQTDADAPTDADAQTDAFAPDVAPGLQLIMLMRIYDVMMGLYMEAAPEKAEELLNAHLEGFVIGASPGFNGRFLTDEAASHESEEQ